MDTLPKRLRGFDTYRDGGSVSADFAMPNGDRVYLTFWVDRDALDRAGSRDRLSRYRSAELTTYINADWRNPVTGVMERDFRTECRPCS